MRIENIIDESDRAYTKAKLLSSLKEKDNFCDKHFNLLLYRWTIGIVREQTDTIIAEIRNYMTELLSFFNRKVENSLNFINGEADLPQVSVDNIANQGNLYKDDDIEIEIGTVHSAKGETHTATLYLETFYKRGQGNYESERLKEQFKNIPVTKTLNDLKTCNDIIKQSAKMAYVGFSRPTHLLCIAIEKIGLPNR